MVLPAPAGTWDEGGLWLPSFSTDGGHGCWTKVEAKGAAQMDQVSPAQAGSPRIF